MDGTGTVGAQSLCMGLGGVPLVSGDSVLGVFPIPQKTHPVSCDLCQNRGGGNGTGASVSPDQGFGGTGKVPCNISNSFFQNTLLSIPLIGDKLPISHIRDTRSTTTGSVSLPVVMYSWMYFLLATVLLFLTDI